MFRLATLAFAALTALLAALPLSRAEEHPSLLTLIGEWQYPGSKMHGASMSDGATVNAAGDRTVPSVVCKTVLTTPDPIDKVVQFYEAKLKAAAQPAPAPPEPPAGAAAKPAASAGRSVALQDDSADRPLTVHVIAINTEKTSTTLVISRAKTETETHIAWTRYERF